MVPVRGSLDAKEIGTPGCDCLLYTSDAADERSSVDLGGRRIIKTKKSLEIRERRSSKYHQQQKCISDTTLHAVLK